MHSEEGKKILQSLTKSFFILLFVLQLLSLNVFASQTGSEAPKKQAINNKIEVLKKLERLDSYIVKNQGIVKDDIEYLTIGGYINFWFSKDRLKIVFIDAEGDRRLMSLKDAMEFKTYANKKEVEIIPIGRNRAEIVAEIQEEGKLNIFQGNEVKDWRTNLTAYRAIRYKGVNEGVDVIFSMNREGEIKKVIEVSKGEGLKGLRFKVKGAEDIEKGQKDTELRIKVSSENFISLTNLQIYQEIGGKRVKVEGKYKVNRVGNDVYYEYELGGWDQKKPLIIEQVIKEQHDWFYTHKTTEKPIEAMGVTVDGKGNVYIIANHCSEKRLENYDNNVNEFIDAAIGNKECKSISVIKLYKANGYKVSYHTVLTGDGENVGYDIVADEEGNTYLTGVTTSSDFPITKGAFGKRCENRDVFLTKINPEGNLVYSTYIGTQEDEQAIGIAIDNERNIYITGYTTSNTEFPDTKNCSKVEASKVHKIGSNLNQKNIFITKFNTKNETIEYSTIVGGSANEIAFDIAIDGSGNAYITGLTNSADFVTTKDAISIKHRGAFDAIVMKVNRDGKGIDYATYLGGRNHDVGYGIAVDERGNAYVTGYTYSYDFPTTKVANPLREKVYKIDTNVEYSYKDKFLQDLCGRLYLLDKRLKEMQSKYSKQKDIEGYKKALKESAFKIFEHHYVRQRIPEIYKIDSGDDKCNLENMNKLLSSNEIYKKMQPYIEDDVEDFKKLIIQYEGAKTRENLFLLNKIAILELYEKYGKYDFFVHEEHKTTVQSEVFIVKLNMGSKKIEYSIQVGGIGSDAGTSILVDKNGEVYVVGNNGTWKYSNTFPFSQEAIKKYGATYAERESNPEKDSNVFVLKISDKGERLQHLSYIEKRTLDEVNAMTLSKTGDLFLIADKLVKINVNTIDKYDIRLKKNNILENRLLYADRNIKNISEDDEIYDYEKNKHIKNVRTNYSYCDIKKSTSTSGYFYRGIMGKNLQFHMYLDEDGCSGHYQYGEVYAKDVDTIELKCRKIDGDEFEIEEFYKEKKTGEFIGKFTDFKKKEAKGIWRSPDGRKSFEFQMNKLLTKKDVTVSSTSGIEVDNNYFSHSNYLKKITPYIQGDSVISSSETTECFDELPRSTKENNSDDSSAICYAVEGIISAIEGGYVVRDDYFEHLLFYSPSIVQVLTEGSYQKTKGPFFQKPFRVETYIYDKKQGKYETLDKPLINTNSAYCVGKINDYISKKIFKELKNKKNTNIDTTELVDLVNSETPVVIGKKGVLFLCEETGGRPSYSYEGLCDNVFASEEGYESCAFLIPYQELLNFNCIPKDSPLMEIIKKTKTS